MDQQPPPLTPGVKASEFHLSSALAVFGFIVTMVSLGVGAAGDAQLALPPWAKLLGVGAGVVMAVLPAVGYTKSRSTLKLEQLRATVTPMLPQLLSLVNQVVDVVKDIKAGGLTAPADTSAPAPQMPSQALADTVDAAPLQTVTMKLTSVASGGTPLATAISEAAEQLAQQKGAAAAAEVKTAEDAAKVLNSTK